MKDRRRAHACSAAVRSAFRWAPRARRHCGLSCTRRSRGRNGAMVADIDRDSVEKVYARWAPVYDLVFGPLLERGRRASIAAADRVGGRILELGVGTGISLPVVGRHS